MAEFKGTFSEFIEYLNPYCRNKVLAITRKHKKQYGSICQYCGEKAEIEAAHIKGEERVTIIRRVLNEKFSVSTDEYCVNLEIFKEIFVTTHEPIEDHFFFLCSKCHRKYDNGTLSDEEILDKRIEQLTEMLKKKKEETKPNKDSSRKKYIFNGVEYNLCRLVLAVIKEYVNRNPTVKINQLKLIFPSVLLGGRKLEVVEEETVAKKENARRSDTPRYFAGQNEIISLVDGNICVCTQWGSGSIGNIEKFVAHARKLGFEII